MKLTRNIRTCAAALALLGAACDNSEYDLQQMIPDSYHAIVNIREDANESVRIYDTGQTKVYEFTVLRGGSDPSQPIEAEARPMTGEELAEFNADYELLPAAYFTLDGKISIPAQETADMVTVTFTGEQIAAVRTWSQGLEKSKIACLALKIESRNASVFDDKGYVIRRLDVMLPELGFVDAGEQQLNLYDVKQPMSFDIALQRGESDLSLPVEASIAALSDEEMAALNPDCFVIPADRYALSQRDIAIPAESERTTVGISFSGEQISQIRQMAESSGKQACLALKLVSQTASAIDKRDVLLRRLEITQPILQFEVVDGGTLPAFRQWWWDNWDQDNNCWNRPWTDIKTPRADCWGNGVSFKLKMPEGIQNQWEIKCKLAYDPSYIAAYNEMTEAGPYFLGGIQSWNKKKTYYDPLPKDDDIVFYDAAGNRVDQITMYPGQNEVTFYYKRRTDNWSFDGAGLYLCPIVSSSDLFPTNQQQPHYVLFEDEINLSEDKTFWEPQAAGQGQLSELIDGNRWGNSWQTDWCPGYCDLTYGQYFQINIDKYQPSHGIHIAVWGNCDNEWHWNEQCTPREMKVFITSDVVPAPTGNYEADRATYDALTWVEAGHLWCESHSGLCWISPTIDLQGRTANAIRICTYSRAGESASYKRQDNLGDFNTAPWNDRVESVCNTAIRWNGWEDSYCNNIVITEFKMWGN